MSTTDKPLIDENEWQAQERGMRAALDDDAAGMDTMAAYYAVVARALISAPRSEPPPDFAADITKRIIRHEAGMERFMSRILLAAFVLTTIVACVQYGGQWWRPLHRSFGNDALGWMLAVAGCVALSWTGNQLARLAGINRRHAS